jgi:dienelactone hydrolase
LFPCGEVKNFKIEKLKQRRLNMIRKSIVVLLLVLGFIYSVAAAAEDVTFKSTQKWDGETLTLTGKLWKPSGNGPFPTIVMLHGCSNTEKALVYFNIWANRFADWGYVSLLVDSFGPRGKTQICDQLDYISTTVRTQDAYDAKSYLQKLAFVNGNNISIVGWSHGGITALQVATRLNEASPFNAVVAFYPYCPLLLPSHNTPLLILIGEKDDWCPAARCSNMVLTEKDNKHEVVLKVYPDASHAFDFEGIDMINQGHILKYDPKATADAAIQIKGFLAKHVK